VLVSLVEVFPADHPPTQVVEFHADATGIQRLGVLWWCNVPKSSAQSLVFAWMFAKLPQHGTHRHADAGGIHFLPPNNELTQGHGLPVGLGGQLCPGRSRVR